MKTFTGTYYGEACSAVLYITHLSMLEGRCYYTHFTDEGTELLTSEESSLKFQKVLGSIQIYQSCLAPTQLSLNLP